MSQSSNTPRGTPSEVGGTRSTSTHRDKDDTKVAKPDLYYGDRQGLDDWITQMEIYFQFTPIESNKRTLFATIYLRGRAQHWMKPMLMKFLNGEGDTDGILTSFVNFKKEIRRIFGISNEDKVAVRLIQHIRQHTSASDYAAKFQEYAQITDWDDSALMTMFRRGLKENVKDELMRAGMKIESLDDLIRASIEIDDNLYERAMERRHDVAPRGKSGCVPYRSNNNFKGKKFNRNNNQYSDPYGLQPMELDVTEGRRSQGRKQYKEKSSMTCYGCGKQGHMARDCHSKNKVPRRQFNMTQRRSEEKEPERNEPMETKDQGSHGTLSWTACYDDSCLVHYDAKMGAAWFPSAPKRKGRRQATREINAITREDDLEEGEIEEEDVESDPEEDDDEEESSDEESSDDDHDDHLCDGREGIHTLHAYVPSCFTKMFDIMMKHGEDAFPSINGQRFLHPHNFDNMLDQIRHAFRDHRLVVVEYDFKAFIVERPPLGSTFAPAGYIIPSGERVNNSMRDGIRLLRSRYKQAQQQQRTLYERHLREEHGLDTSLNGKERVRFDSVVSDDSGKE
ncbi:hypothetical protein KCV03_g10361, partial [Aureobasidium melanogenum]